MRSRKARVIRGAVVGGATGLAFSTTAGLIFSSTRLCSYIPGYFDQALAQSSAQLNLKLATVTSAQANLLKEKIGSAADGIGYVFKDSATVDTAMSAIKFVADKIPSVANHLPNVGAYIARTLSVAHPILTGLSYAAFDASTEVLKVALVTTCVEVISQYRVIPVFCLLSTLAGATIGGIVASTDPAPAPTPPQTPTNAEASPKANREEDRKYFLQEQSVFKRKLQKKLSNPPQHRLSRSTSFCG